MESEGAFLEGMWEHPDDDSLRLAFADWLEARHDSRGELLRRQSLRAAEIEEGRRIAPSSSKRCGRHS